MGFGIYFILSLIAVPVICNVFFDIDSVLAIMGIWVVVLLPAAIISSKKDEKETNEKIALLKKAASITKCRLDGDTLYFENRSNVALALFNVVEHKMNFTKYVPEKLHIGAVTTGCVTSGGVYKTGGYNQLLSKKSNKYKLMFVYWDEKAKQIKEHEIKSIELSDKIVPKANKSTIKEYLKKDSFGKTKIIVVNDVKMSPAAVELMRIGSNQEAMNIYQLDKADAYPDVGKIETILKWLCTQG